MGKILYFPNLKIQDKGSDFICDPTERYYYDFYIEHGCEYGDTRAGFNKWMDEAFEPIEDDSDYWKEQYDEIMKSNSLIINGGK